MAEEPKNLMEKAYRQLKNMIFSQRIGPGQKIIFRDLSQRLSMSKTPIMYALGRLEQEGFIKLKPNLGYFVKDFDLKEIGDYFDLREALEVYAITLAIKNRETEDLKKLEEKIRKHKKYVIQVYDRKKLVLDAEVHLQIAQMAKNVVLVRQLHQIFEQIYLRFRVELMHPARLSVSPVEHKKILAMIKKKDASGAEKVIRRHIQAAKQNMISSISRQEIIDFNIPIE